MQQQPPPPTTPLLPRRHKSLLLDAEIVWYRCLDEGCAYYVRNLKAKATYERPMTEAEQLESKQDYLECKKRPRFNVYNNKPTARLLAAAAKYHRTTIDEVETLSDMCLFEGRLDSGIVDDDNCCMILFGGGGSHAEQDVLRVYGRQVDVVVMEMEKRTARKERHFASGRGSVVRSEKSKARFGMLDGFNEVRLRARVKKDDVEDNTWVHVF